MQTIITSMDYRWVRTVRTLAAAMASDVTVKYVLSNFEHFAIKGQLVDQISTFPLESARAHMMGGARAAQQSGGTSSRAERAKKIFWPPHFWLTWGDITAIMTYKRLCLHQMIII